MNEDLQRWREAPVFRELFLQWRAARASAEPRSRPFSRDWEQLLQDAELTSAELRREADRDARALTELGLVELKTNRLRPYQIDRIAIPLAAEARLRGIFADELPALAEAQVDLSSIDWAPQLRFLQTVRTGVPLADLRLLDDFFRRAAAREPVPIKERSLEIFGDEKRLDALLLTTLFRPDRLTFENLACHLVAEPLGWRRGQEPAGPMIVLENAATWDSYCRWDALRRIFSALVYGCGNRFRDGVAFLKEIFQELGGPRPVVYFGDLDVQGIRIPIQASLIARALGLPGIQADLWSYERLLSLGKPQTCETPDPLDAGDFDWFGDLRERASSIVQSKHRLAQEAVGWDFLKNAVRE